MESLKEEYLNNTRGFDRWLIKTGLSSPIPGFKANNLKDFLEFRSNTKEYGSVIFPELQYSFGGRTDNYTMGFSPIYLRDKTSEVKAYVRHSDLASANFFGRNYLIDMIDKYNNTLIAPILEFNAWSPFPLDISRDPKKIYLIDFENKQSKIKAKSDVKERIFGLEKGLSLG